MTRVNVHDAKTHLSNLLERVQAGEEIVICKSGKPIAKLSAYVPVKTPRKPGGWEGRVWMADDFDDLPPELLAAFYGEGEEE